MNTVRRILIVALAAVATMMALNIGSSAQAVTVYQSAGTGGTISVGKVNGSIAGATRYLNVAPMTMSKSPATASAQMIKSNVTLYKWNGQSWVVYKTTNQSWSNVAGSVSTGSLNYAVAPGYYHVMASVSWHYASTGNVFASKALAYQVASDYTVTTPGVYTYSGGGVGGYIGLN